MDPRLMDDIRESLARIDTLDPHLNAFQHVRREEALAEGDAVDPSLPLAGWPVAVKDNMHVAGLPVRHGSAATSDAPAAADDALVGRLRAAGAVVVGTTRMPELAAWGFTSSAAFGPTRNPRDPERDPGGSSGGAAAAVAAGMVRAAVGTDGGGSIRIPAAACGLVGVKPTRGLTPLPGGADDHWYGLTVAGPLARTVGDAAAVLAVVADRPDLATVPSPDRCRVAWSLRSPSPLGRPDARQRAAVRAAAAQLGALGHDVEHRDPRYPVNVLSAWGRSWLAGVAQDAAALGLSDGLLEPRTRAMVRKGRRIGTPGPSTWGQRAADFFAHVDVLVTPTVARPPGRAGSYDGRGYLRTYLGAARSVPFTPAWNLAGLPAVTVPAGDASVQLIGRAHSEPLLLGLAAQLTG